MAAPNSPAEKLITENIDIWTSAIKKRGSQGRGSSKKIELYGVSVLRLLILELSFSGKLTEQSNENAVDLLTSLTNIKNELIKKKVLKKNKPNGAVEANEVRITIPNNWKWSRLGDAFDVRDGTHDSPKYQECGYPLVTSKNIYNGVLDLSNIKYISEEDHLKISERSKVDRGDILFAMIGSIGNPVIIDIEPNFSVKNVGLFKYYDPKQSNPKYLQYYLMLAEKWFKEESTGAVQSFVSLGKLRSFPFPVAPLKEQDSIVAKVDELMALCDQLEQQTETSLLAHQTLVETLLNTLLNADQNSFDPAWERIAQHFDVLFTTEHSIDQLKQTILQLAVMGKLVPQDPNDEPASVLLEKIATEKEQLIKDKVIKKQKPLPPISEDEKPLELPQGWELVRLDDVCFGITSGSTPPKSEFDENEGVPYLKVYNIKEQKIAFDYKPQYVKSEYHSTKLKRSILYPGDVIMNIVGPPLGKVAIIPDSHPEWNCNQAITFFRPILKELNNYIYTYLLAGTFLNSIELIGTAGQDNISVTKSRSITFPFPPIKEQAKIIVRVNELMKLCDVLKSNISVINTTQLHLADAMAEQALN